MINNYNMGKYRHHCSNTASNIDSSVDHNERVNTQEVVYHNYIYWIAKYFYSVIIVVFRLYDAYQHILRF